MMLSATESLTLLLWVVLIASSVVDAIRVLPSAERSAADEVVSSILLEEPPELPVSSADRHRKLSSTVEVPFPATPEDHEIKSLPLLAEGTLTTKHWAGLLPASAEKDKYFFYWLFAPDTSQHAELKDGAIPLVIWLNGGPGCSSMDGLFLENGPLRFEKDESGSYKLVAAQHSWHKTPAYMLYIDQPVGTGLSFTTSKKYPRNDLEVNQDFYYFFQSFLKAHSDKFVTSQRLNRPFYFSGESHAGHYIPSMMAFILDQNKQLGPDAINVPLSGAAIGNGWVDPFHQYAAAEAAYGHGIIGLAQKAAFEEKEKQCQAYINEKKFTASVCFNLLDDIVKQSYGSKSSFKVSQYDIRQVETRGGDRNFPPGHKVVEAYLGDKGTAAGITTSTMNDALQAIHASESRAAGQRFQECTDPPYNALSHQDGLGVVNEVIQVLEYEPAEGETDVRLLFFNGVTDLICNHVGNEIMLEQLSWKHQSDWTKAARSAWKSKSQKGDKISGYMKEFKNLLYLKVMDSGHMVPMDVPEVSLDMMRLFVFGGEGAFQYSPQALDRSIKTDGTCPSCPVCPANITNFQIDSLSKGSEDTDDASSADNTKLYVGLGLLAGVIVVVIGLQFRSKRKTRVNGASYDLEMRGGTYFDEPEPADGASTDGDKSASNFRER
ncbi:Pheromone-processing carboxypeptidase KEX1 [Seminavis robusta]|uniref:Pheromone-processing carboxypeptidase KEX1 n=1 Tax=Seminavis robusta TaxID=568900 RepID=A0A9N8DRL1_9STRA|nr:Pheromone-processing carboxypeptidase KEX1 [Seminavis robusta]|eukprot:Sro320_g116520.1 Pheromone-processing carboxypeptidase KEX1 (662) ;mRNA; r:36564-38793